MKEDKDTHINWIDLGKAFTKDLEFFKGVAALFTATAIHTGIFPIFIGFKYQKDGDSKMRKATIFGVLMATFLNVFSMIILFFN